MDSPERPPEAPAGTGSGRGRHTRPLLSASWRTADYVAVDVETTGLDPRTDRVIAFGAVPVRDGRIVSAEARYLTFNPCSPIPPESTKVHGLHLRDLQDAPEIGACLPEIAEIVEGRVLIAHSAWVEREFLLRLLRRNGYGRGTRTVDTARLAGRLLGGGPLAGHEISLEYASAALGLPPHTPHHALGDAMTTAQLFLALSRQVSGGEPTLGDLVEPRWPWGRRWMRRAGKRNV